MTNPGSVRLRGRRMIVPVWLWIVSAFVVACSSTTDVGSTYEASPVVRAFLYAGEPVTDIRLTWTTTLTESDTVPKPVNNAQVTLIRQGVRFALALSPGDSGYYRYTGAELVVREGDVFDFEARIGDGLVTARTTVPARPGSVSKSADTVRVPDFSSFTPGQRPSFDFTTVTVRWPASTGSLYYVTLENLESSPVSIADSSGRFRFGPARTVFSPTAADSFAIGFNQVKYYGLHRVRVYHVNEEYAQLYATQQQNSRDLNEPFTNIHGGLGVFSAFASDTTRVVVAKQ
jgi:hypothetical protein